MSIRFPLTTMSMASIGTGGGAVFAPADCANAGKDQFVMGNTKAATNPGPVPYEQQVVRIVSRDMELAVHPEGAKVTEFKVAGHDILHLDVNDLKHSGIPICFPQFGPLPFDLLGVRGRDGLREKQYPMGQHGFLRGVSFPEIVASEDGKSIRCVYTATSELVPKKYPHNMRFVVDYEIREHHLFIHFAVTNHSDQMMFVSPGLHPYFKVEDPHQVSFRTSAKYGYSNLAPENENSFVKSEKIEDLGWFENMTPDEQMEPQWRVQGAPDFHMMNPALNGRHVRVNIMPGTDRYSLNLEYAPEKFPYLIVWRKTAEEPYICIEAGGKKGMLQSLYDREAGLESQQAAYYNSIAPGQVWTSRIVIGVNLAA